MKASTITHELKALMTDMPRDTQLFLPAKDRSFWKADDSLNSPLSYLAWGERDFKKERIPQSYHDGWVCGLVQEGRPLLEIESETFPVIAGTLFLIGPDCPFGWVSEEEMSCRFLLWMWKELDCDSVFQDSERQFQKMFINRQHSLELEVVHEACRREALNWDKFSSSAVEGHRLVVSALLNRYFKNQTKQSRTQGRVDQAIDWLEKHMDSPEPVSRLCDYLMVSQSTLHRLFKDTLGRSPANIVHEIRMKRAQEILKTTNQSIKEIAFQLGYLHFNDFSRAYKRFHGCSPSDTRSPKAINSKIND